MAFQSLYRRYRPQRFGEVIGQDHLVTALRNAVIGDRVAHAYLLSGPRGTGKTTTARILAKALNCQDLGDDGEPCGACDSCVAIERGSSFDLHELDAASNNSVDDIRGLNERVALGTPGRRKVYLLDEVHMLSRGAANALLKTLEEPPDHVVFVLATTDPQKVLPTVRSRTQHFELNLVGADLVAAHVRQVAARAGLEIDETIVEHVVAAGRGSVRDTLSALDRVVAAGGVGDTVVDVDAVVDGLAERDTVAVLAAVARTVAAGADPRDLTEQLARDLRDTFLVIMGVESGMQPPGRTERLAEAGGRLGAATCVRALELLGTALVDMRQAPDPRLTLEVALVRLTAPEADVSVESLAQRVERLERGGGSGSPGTGPADAARAAISAAAPPPATAPASTSAPPPPPAAAAEAAAPPPAPAPASTTAVSPSPATSGAPSPPHAAAAGELPATVTRDQLTLDWPELLERISKRARARLSAGRWKAVVDGAALFAVPNEPHRQRCLDLVPEMEATLAAHYGAPVPVRLVADDGTAAGDDSSGPDAKPVPTPTEARPAAPDPGEVDDVHDLDDTVAADDSTPRDSLSRITEAFPGAVVVEGER